MNTNQIITFISDLGGIFSPASIPLVRAFFQRMIEDERVVVIFKQNTIHSVLAFSLSDDFKPFYTKETWDYVPHNPDGSVFYVELLASRTWDKKLRKQFQSLILEKYPQIQSAVWHKWADWGDRKVIWRRPCTKLKS